MKIKKTKNKKKNKKKNSELLKNTLFWKCYY